MNCYKRRKSDDKCKIKGTIEERKSSRKRSETKMREKKVIGKKHGLTQE